VLESVAYSKGEAIGTSAVKSGACAERIFEKIARMTISAFIIIIIIIVVVVIIIIIIVVIIVIIIGHS
jgi:hypothetical protein